MRRVVLIGLDLRLQLLEPPDADALAPREAIEGHARARPEAGSDGHEAVEIRLGLELLHRDLRDEELGGERVGLDLPLIGRAARERLVGVEDHRAVVGHADVAEFVGEGEALADERLLAVHPQHPAPGDVRAGAVDVGA